MRNKFIGLILVRSQSSRLPGKCFFNFGKVNILEHMILRCRYFKIEPIICTTNKKKDNKIISILKKINHIETYKKAHAERNILKVLEGDCETAVGVHSKIEDDQLTVEAELFSLDGSERYYEKKIVEKSKFREIGEEIGETLKRKSNNSYKK